MNDAIDIDFREPFRVGDWQVDSQNNQLQLGDKLISLEPRVMDVLVYLAERRGQVVTREELEDKVWAGRIVSYDALTNSVVKLRKAFKIGTNELVIKTIPKRGYSLVTLVTPI